MSGGRAPLTSAPALIAATAASVVVSLIGSLAGRPDVIALAVPLALWAVLAMAERRPRRAPHISLAIDERAQARSPVVTLEVDGDGDATQVHLETGAGRVHELVLAAGTDTADVHMRLFHSGPATLFVARARTLSADGARVSRVSAPRSAQWNAAPDRVAVDTLPLARRLPGLDGAHIGIRPGQGGDFRDIHPFHVGDELRRVDWRATARLARRPEDLFVRRTHATSDASIVIVVDTADDLGAQVMAWGSDDPERIGVTSLDRAREAARSIAEEAVASGDRIAYIELAMAGRSVRSGSGRRHLAHVLSAIAATGPRDETERYVRTPPVPAASTIVILSTFFDGDASRLAVLWSASGHRVIAVDTLPDADRSRLKREQDLIARVVFAERREVFHDLAGAGVRTVAHSAVPGALAATLRLASRESRS